MVNWELSKLLTKPVPFDIFWQWGTDPLKAAGKLGRSSNNPIWVGLYSGEYGHTLARAQRFTHVIHTHSLTKAARTHAQTQHTADWLVGKGRMWGSDVAGANNLNKFKHHNWYLWIMHSDTWFLIGREGYKWKTIIPKLHKMEYHAMLTAGKQGALKCKNENQHYCQRRGLSQLQAVNSPTHIVGPNMWIR